MLNVHFDDPLGYPRAKPAQLALYMRRSLDCSPFFVNDVQKRERVREKLPARSP
jgi:hypothetical protein